MIDKMSGNTRVMCPSVYQSSHILSAIFNRNVVIVIAFCLEPAYEPVLFLVGGRVPLMERANNITIAMTNLNNTRRTARMPKGTALRAETLSIKSTVVLVADWVGARGGPAMSLSEAA